VAIDAVSLAAKALDGLYLRSAALAHNLANMSSPRFQSLEVNFEGALRKAASQGPAAVDALQFGFTAGRLFGPGDEQREDLLLVDASINAMRYAALSDLIGRRLAIASAAAGAR
jgi:flagellar basal-body rod protein FlgB